MGPGGERAWGQRFSVSTAPRPLAVAWQHTSGGERLRNCRWRAASLGRPAWKSAFVHAAGRSPGRWRSAGAVSAPGLFPPPPGGQRPACACCHPLAERPRGLRPWAGRLKRRGREGTGGGARGPWGVFLSGRRKQTAFKLGREGVLCYCFWSDPGSGKCCLFKGKSWIAYHVSWFREKRVREAAEPSILKQ